MSGPIRGLGMFVAVIMGIGACFGGMNTMYAAVAVRTREVGTLRALGFSKGSIMMSFVIESVIIALIGGVLGCLLALPVNGIATGTMNFRTFSELGVQFSDNSESGDDGDDLRGVYGVVGRIVAFEVCGQAADHESVAGALNQP